MANEAGELRDARAEQLALHMARGLCCRDAAKQIGMAYRTANRRTADPRFMARLNELRSGLLTDARNRIVGAMGQAIDVLAALLSNSDDAVKLKAADKLLTHALRLDERAELVERLERLERLLATQDPKGRTT
jgi:hypothetical protein